MPTARSPSTCWTASVTIPAGFVKLISQAFGACLAIVSARRTITGIVRSAKQMPPGPVVSWPSTPSPSGTSSSTTRPSSWPTRIAQKTKSAPSTASTRSVVARNGSRVAVLGREPVEHVRRCAPAATASMSCRTTSSQAEPLGLLQQRAVDERDAEAAAADDRQLHATVTSIPAASTAERHGGRQRRVGDDVVDRLRAADAHHAGHRELGGVGDQDDLVGAGDHQPLDRDLDHRRVPDAHLDVDAARAQEERCRT